MLPGGRARGHRGPEDRCQSQHPDVDVFTAATGCFHSGDGKLLSMVDDLAFARFRLSLSQPDLDLLDVLPHKLAAANRSPRPNMHVSTWWHLIQAADPRFTQAECEALANYAVAAIACGIVSSTPSEQMAFSVQNRHLQNSMQSDNRQFTMVSNLMKAKHDTVKNTISNIH